MEMRKCERGHYYDASIHMNCPYCSSTANTEMTVAMGMMPVQSGSVETTMPMGMTEKPFGEDDEGRTIAILETDNGIEPVVGWLVGLTGKNRGKEFRLHCDNNFIGRSEKMDVCIKQDDTISRENQAILTYDMGEGVYYLSPGSGRSLTKVNEKTIFQTVELKAYDRIKIGKTELLFAPLCGEMFSWEE